VDEADQQLWEQMQALALPENPMDPHASRSPWRLTQPHCPRNGKYAFRTRKLALTRLNELRTKGVSVTQVYRCSSCNKWHLTSQAPESSSVEADQR
jgi:transposase-like protein